MGVKTASSTLLSLIRKNKSDIKIPKESELHNIQLYYSTLEELLRVFAPVDKHLMVSMSALANVWRTKHGKEKGFT